VRRVSSGGHIAHVRFIPFGRIAYHFKAAVEATSSTLSAGARNHQDRLLPGSLADTNSLDENSFVD
jgi:hypothetical protein